MSSSFYYAQNAKGVHIHKVSADLLGDMAAPPTEDVDRTEAVAAFCRRIQMMFGRRQTRLLIDYYVDGRSYNDLKKAYGNVAKLIRQIDLQPVFDEIRAELS